MNSAYSIGSYVLVFLLGILVGRLVSLVFHYFVERNLDPNGNNGHSRKELAVKLISGLGFVALFAKIGFSPVFFVLAAFCSALFAILLIDMEKMIIPDAISLNGIVLGLLISSCELIPPMDWKTSLYGIVLGAAILYTPAYLFKLITGGDGLGGGDVKLMAMVGAFTGVQGVVFTLIIASLTGCLVGMIGGLYKRISQNSLIPFGPFISCSAILYIFIGKTLIENFFRLTTQRDTGWFYTFLFLS